jgi:hypothetical protein
MNAMSGSVPAQAELNWQMTGLFLSGFVMKPVVVLVLQASYDMPGF